MAGQRISKDQGRRQYDGSTKSFLALGIGGGSVVGILISVFTFMNSAPWASKEKVESLETKVTRIEMECSNKYKSLQDTLDSRKATEYAIIADIASLKSDSIQIKESLRDIKADLKDRKR